MMPEETIIRVDATDPPMVGPGDRVRAGQKVCSQSGSTRSPVAGTVREIRFDRETHEFLIVVTPE
jgi:hypothetical protein